MFVDNFFFIYLTYVDKDGHHKYKYKKKKKKILLKKNIKIKSYIYKIITIITLNLKVS